MRVELSPREARRLRDFRPMPSSDIFKLQMQCCRRGDFAEDNKRSGSTVGNIFTRRKTSKPSS